MQFVPYLMFNGQCKEAFKFYEKCLGGTLMVLTYGDSPAAAEVPPEARDKVMHAQLTAGDAVLMGSDDPSRQAGKGAYVALVIDDLAKAEKIFKALSAKGTIQAPFEQTFWAKRFGMFIDRFGTPWMINCQLVGSQQQAESTQYQQT